MISQYMAGELSQLEVLYKRKAKGVIVYGNQS